MKKLLGRLGFRKMDEMERHIAFRAQSNAYLFLGLALAAWSLYESWRVWAYHERLNLLPGGLLAGAVLIQCASQLIMTRRAVAGDEDSYETGPLVRLVLLIFAVVGVIVTAVAAVLLMGVWV